MATATIQITASGSTVGRTKTVSGPDLVRLLDAYRGILGPISDGTSNGFRAMTDSETILAWADGLIAGTKANVRGWERGVAATSVTATIAEIGFT